MTEYPKIENLYARDPETHKSGPEHGFRLPAVGQIAQWLVLEKVDGMNMRVVFTPAEVDPVHIFGRTDRAQIPADLCASIAKWAQPYAFFEAFADEDGIGPAQVILFGEGFGAGIQQGGHYRPDKGFILFDVLVDGHWLSWLDVVDVAGKLGIEHVPVLAHNADLDLVTLLVEDRMSDLTDPEHVEGVIARTDPYLFDGRGRRVMFKYKVRDL